MWLLIVLFSAVLVLVHWFLTSSYGYWKKRGVPNPPPNILFGNMKDSVLLKKNLGQTYRDIYNEYTDNLYVGYYKFFTPGIILRDMDLVKIVLVNNFANFHDNDINIDEKVDPLFGKNPFCLTGQKWKQIRTLVGSEITNSKVKNMLYLITNVCKEMVEYIETNLEASKKDGFEAKELSRKFTTDAVATCTLGLDGKSFTDSDSEFQQMAEKFLSPTFWTAIRHMILFILPGLSKLFSVKFVSTEVEQWFTNIVKETIKYRQKNNVVRNDYLDMLIGLRSKPGYHNYSDTDIAAQAMTFYGDGFETSSITLSHTLYELGENLDIQEKLRIEIDSVLEKYKGEITYEAIQEMHFLDNVLSEGLRKHSPILFIARLCTKRFELPPPRGEGTGPNIVVETGTPMIIPILAIHNDPNHYPDPQKFDPDRFTEKNKKNRHKYTFLAFGEGPRICLGPKFGLAQTKAALIAIVSNFEIRVNPKTQKPLQMDPKYFMNFTKGGLWLNFIKREK